MCSNSKRRGKLKGKKDISSSVFLSSHDSLPMTVLQKWTEKVSTKIKQLQDQTDKLTAHNTLPRLAGPVTSNLDSVLHKYQIYPQAYHIRAFIENHCHKYLMAKVYQGICDSVVTKAEELCDHRNVAVRAQCLSIGENSQRSASSQNNTCWNHTASHGSRDGDLGCVCMGSKVGKRHTLPSTA